MKSEMKSEMESETEKVTPHTKNQLKTLLGKPFLIEGLILLIALLLRLLFLNIKPYHFDEGINGFFVLEMDKKGFYSYDPKNYHGPLYFYILFLSTTLLGKNYLGLRLPAALASLASVWVTLRYDRFLGKKAAALAALTIALSPGSVFYGRYAIHESHVALSLLITMWGVLGIWQEGNKKYLYATLGGITALLLLKETWIIHITCILLTIPSLWIWNKIQKSSIPPVAKQTWNANDLAKTLLVCLLSLLFFYTGGFIHLKGAKDFFLSFAEWISTGTDEKNGHYKTWTYWLTLIKTYELPVCIGILYSLRVLWKPNPNARFLAIYALGTLTAYSIVPYKTPWCIISLLWPFQLLFGYAIIQEWNSTEKPWKKTAILITSLVLLGTSCYQTIKLNFFNYEKEGELYAYVQTSNAFKEKLITPLLALATQDKTAHEIGGVIAQDSYYPIPWELRDFNLLAYCSKTSLPKPLNQGFIYADADRKTEVEKLLEEPYYRVEFQSKNDKRVTYVWFKRSLFNQWFLNKNHGEPTIILPKNQQKNVPKNH